ncbi:MAG TPA: hypothetical protein VGF67_30285 [Ktedonobacteraceae bacterium]
MKQSDGSELLGPDDPRNIVIGIIHVSPNDDRQSVITAITTQDKMGRDQIVLDLPAQNRSFKTAVDFEGLHQMASDIEATLVLVVPAKSKVAGFARRERFTVYSSLDELILAEFPPMEPDGVQAPQVANGSVAAVEDDEDDHARVFPVLSSPAPFPPSPDVPTSGPPEQTALLPAEAQADEEPTDPALRTVGAAPVDQESPPVEIVQPAVAGSNLPVPMSSAALVPSATQLPVYYEPIEPVRQRSWRTLLIAGLILLLLLGMGVLLYRPVLNVFFPPTATVTILPDSQRLAHTYAMQAVLGVPDPLKNQIDARALYANSQTQSQTVKATGQGHIAGQQAQGTLTFYNTSTTSQTVPAGTVIFTSSGVALVNDDTLTLPPFDPAAGPAATTDSAHTVNVGRSQNIAANALNNQLCCGGSIYVSNTEPFFGGQDTQTYTYVQQSDIDGVSAAQSTALVRQATMALQGQVRANERPVGTPRCAPQVTSNHQAGDRVSSVSVDVMVSCVGEVYDMQAVQVLASRDLTQDATVNPGPSFVPVGAIVAQVAKATPDSQGNIALVVNALGVWVYQFTDAQRTHLAGLIAAKNSQDAQALLLRQTGVSRVMITLTGVGATALPGDTQHITVAIEAVQGLHT